MQVSESVLCLIPFVVVVVLWSWAPLLVCCRSYLYRLYLDVQVTVWGPAASNLRDYAYKLWAGLVGTYYIPRWFSWFDAVGKSIASGTNFNQSAFTENLTAW